MRKRSLTRKPVARLAVPRDCATEWRWSGRAEIILFVVISVLVMWPLLETAVAIGMLP